jgi:hypothetical protein
VSGVVPGPVGVIDELRLIEQIEPRPPAVAGYAQRRCNRSDRIRLLAVRRRQGHIVSKRLGDGYRRGENPAGQSSSDSGRRRDISRRRFDDRRFERIRPGCHHESAERQKAHTRYARPWQHASHSPECPLCGPSARHPAGASSVAVAITVAIAVATRSGASLVERHQLDRT